MVSWVKVRIMRLSTKHMFRNNTPSALFPLYWYTFCWTTSHRQTESTSQRGIVIIINWTWWQTQSCKDIINCFLLSNTSLTWFSFHCSQQASFSVSLPIASLLFLFSYVLSLIVSLLWFSYVLFRFSLPPFLSQLQLFQLQIFQYCVISNTESFSIHSRLAFTHGFWFRAW